MNLRRALTGTAASIAVVAAITGSAWAGGNGAEKVRLTDSLSYTCGGGGIGGTPTKSFAILNQHDGILSVQLQIMDGAPNATYTFWAIQTPGGSDCNHPDATVTTDQNGHGVLQYQEPIVPGSTGAWIAAFSFDSGAHGYSANAVLQK